MTIEHAIQKLINRNQQLVNKNGVTTYTRESEDIINTILAFYHTSNDVLLNERKVPAVSNCNNTAKYIMNMFDVFDKNSIIVPEPSLEFTLHFIFNAPVPYRELITYMVKNGHMDNYRAVLLNMQIRWIESEIDYVLSITKLIQDFSDSDIRSKLYSSTGVHSFLLFNNEDIPTVIRMKEIYKIYSQL